MESKIIKSLDKYFSPCKHIDQNMGLKEITEYNFPTSDDLLIIKSHIPQIKKKWNNYISI